jgi:cytidylate kinase
MLIIDWQDLPMYQIVIHTEFGKNIENLFIIICMCMSQKNTRKISQ